MFFLLDFSVLSILFITIRDLLERVETKLEEVLTLHLCDNKSCKIEWLNE